MTVDPLASVSNYYVGNHATLRSLNYIYVVYIVSMVQHSDRSQPAWTFCVDRYNVY